jgi:hypothetical protein
MHPTSFVQAVSLFVILGIVAMGCADGGTGFDTGTADITIEREGEEPLRLVHDPELSQISMTPPTERIVEVVFAYQDPLVTLRLVINGQLVVEGDQISFPVASPLTPDDLLLTIEIDDELFGSDDVNAGGSVFFDVLEIDEDNDYADVIATLDAVLVGTTSNLTVSGSVEARVGELP